jgi:hypothetical protein
MTEQTSDEIVREFIVERDNFINAINEMRPFDTPDYYRCQGHAEARRQLSERLAQVAKLTLPDPRVFLPGETVPAGLDVVDRSGLWHWWPVDEVVRFPVVSEMPLFADQWKAIVDRARTEREAQA